MKTKRRFLSTVALSAVALFAALSAARLAQGQDSNAPYASKAPVDQYLMADRDAEIALARTAAPKSISDGAEVLVLGRDGYTTAVKGENGFVCWWSMRFPPPPISQSSGIPRIDRRSA